MTFPSASLTISSSSRHSTSAFSWRCPTPNSLQLPPLVFVQPGDNNVPFVGWVDATVHDKPERRDMGSDPTCARRGRPPRPSHELRLVPFLCPAFLLSPAVTHIKVIAAARDIHCRWGNVIS